MDVMETILPGGLPTRRGVERRVRFKQLTGHTELALIELDKNLSRPSYASSVLTLTLDSIGDQAVDRECVMSLCVADCQFLMLRLSAMLAGEQQWLKVTCSHCDAFFDVDFRRNELPVKEAGQGFPYTTLSLEAGEAELRVPTAADQCEVAKLHEHEAMWHMLRCSIQRIDHTLPALPLIRNLSGVDIAAIDQALDAVSPAVCNELLVVCPECDGEQSTRLDHYKLSGLDGNAIYDDIHTLAMYYHWSETAILDMTRARRYKYLELIDRSRAMHGQVA
ncbi:MAG TPA: hypothetical protein ENK04_02650 [Gammaproteobacteria bacterium]|nr:hypothetical protein [Gammaproteobacteria bacterium]